MDFCPSLVVAAGGAEDVFSFGHEAFVGQTEGTFLAVEAIFMPGASLKVHNIHTFTKTCKESRAETKTELFQPACVCVCVVTVVQYAKTFTFLLTHIFLLCVLNT